MSMNTGVWIGEETSKCVVQPPEVKINPNGVDLSVSEVWKFSEKSIARIHGKERTISPEKELIKPKEDGFYYLKEGTYELRTANKVNIPDNAVGFCFPRSTLNRFGVIKSETAVWDSGYSGYGTLTVRVTIEELQIHKNEFWFQLVIMGMKENTKQRYDGHWQGEAPKEE